MLNKCFLDKKLQKSFSSFSIFGLNNLTFWAKIFMNIYEMIHQRKLLKYFKSIQAKLQKINVIQYKPFVYSIFKVIAKELLIQ